MPVIFSFIFRRTEGNGSFYISQSHELACFRVYCLYGKFILSARMKNFVVAVVLVLIFTLFAVANTTAVPIEFVTLSFKVPLSLALIVPIGITLLIFSLFHLRKMGKTELIIRDLEENVESSQKQVVEITKRTHELELENRKFKIRLGEETEKDDTSL